MHGHGLHNPKKAGLSGLFLCAAFALACLAVPGRALAAPLAIEITAASPAYYQGDNEPLVTLKMSKASQISFAELTKNNIGRKLEIRVDGKLISVTVIREPISGGAFQIAGDLNVEQVREIAHRLNAGIAKLEVEIVN